MKPALVVAALGLVLAGCVETPAADVDAASLDPAAVLGGVPVYGAVAVGSRGAEPSIGVTSTGAGFLVSRDLVWRSTDAGLTWEVSHEFGPVKTGVPNPGVPFVDPNDPVRNNDPMLWVDPTTDRVFAPLMFPILTCSQAIWSDDDGASWLEKPLACGLPGVDHQRLATGPYVAGGPLRATPLYPNAVYYCYSKIVSYHCAVSLDGGLHFPIDRLVDAEVCPGPGGTPAAAPDGTVYVPLGGLGGCDTVAIGVSRDNGLTWEVRTPDVGDLGQTEIDPDITVTPDGTAYYAFRASKDNVVHVIRSTDGFETIEGPFRVPAPDVTSTNFVAITSGDDGKVAVAYLGTRDTAAFASDAPDDTRWHLFVATAFDAASEAPRFVNVQVTPDEDPVQIGRIHYGGGTDPARNLLEFIDAVTDAEGRVWIAFTDGCTPLDPEVEGSLDCAGNPDATADDSRDRATSAAVLREGPRLRSG